MLCSWLSRTLPHTVCKGKASGLKSKKIQVPTTCKVSSNPIVVSFFLNFGCINHCIVLICFNVTVVDTHTHTHTHKSHNVRSVRVCV